MSAQLRQYGRTWMGPPPVVAAIAKREEFHSGALRGETVDDPLSYSVSPGRLEGAALGAWRAAQLDDMAYAVWSYGTPIAWWSLERGWTVPEDRYSLTTTRHQGFVRQAVSL